MDRFNNACIWLFCRFRLDDPRWKILVYIEEIADLVFLGVIAFLVGLLIVISLITGNWSWIRELEGKW